MSLIFTKKYKEPLIKKQNVIVHSSAKAEYPATTTNTCKFIWIKQLLQDLKFGDFQEMKLCCDNHAAFIQPLIWYFTKEPSILEFIVILLERKSFQKKW